jgi:hypothetical protein
MGTGVNTVVGAIIGVNETIGAGTTTGAGAISGVDTDAGASQLLVNV